MSQAYLSRAPEEASIAPNRKLGPISMHCVMEESHEDALEITEHPVEQGASINDHAWKKPATLVLRAGWSNSSRAAGGNDSYIREVYAALLELQESREPFDVVTGKRSYKNMLLESLSMTTDQATEHALFVTCTVRQVNIVETQATSLPPRRVHKSPASTGGVTEKGTKQPVEAENRSALAELFG